MPAREGRRRSSASTPIRNRQAEYRRLSATAMDLAAPAPGGEAPEQATEPLTNHELQQAGARLDAWADLLYSNEPAQEDDDAPPAGSPVRHFISYISR